MSIPVPSAQTDLTHPKYRGDIDGLRAIAVLSVVTFHVFPDWIKGGFVGVDVFFIISGFLISSIILSNLQRGTFSFSEFYVRRIKRIFPALILVLVTCWILGWFLLLPEEYRRLGKHIAGGAGFLSNFLFWQEAGYFDNAATTKPLLHLWSLGIEEQYYVVWPLILYVAFKRYLNILILIIAIALVSFSLNVYVSHVDHVQGFYSPLMRAWELLMGSLLAYLTLHKISISEKICQALSMALRKSVVISDSARNSLNHAKSLIGALLVGSAFFLISKESLFPGWWALLPTVGAFLIISAGQHAWLNRTLLSHRLLIWFGLISYPLYLWHWPLLSFMNVILGEAPPVEMRIILVLVSIGLAWLTYMYVEKPIRFNKSLRPAVMMSVMIFVVGLLGVLTYFMEKNEDQFFRTITSLNPTLASNVYGGRPASAIDECGINDPQEKVRFAVCSKDSRGPIKYALLGDSKADSIYPGLVNTSTDDGRWLFVGGVSPGKGSPLPVLSSNPIYSGVQEITLIAVERISDLPEIKTVVLVAATRALFRLENNYSIADLPRSNNYPAALEGLSNVVNRFVRAGKKVVLVVDNPSFKDPKLCVKRTTILGVINNYIESQERSNCSISIDRHMQLSQQYRQLLSEVQRLHPERVSIFETLEHLCDVQSGLCLPYKNEKLLYSYSDHISDYAAEMIGKDLNEFLSTF
ncbi:MAG: acyltransferase family protein [Gallionella sp.]